jgi:hypothetical protein
MDADRTAYRHTHYGSYGRLSKYVLQQLPLGGVDAVTGSTYQPAPQLVPFYQKMFALYGNTAGTPLASAVDPSTGACVGGNTPQNCQFGNLGRNALRGPDFTWSDLYLTKWFTLTEHVKLRMDGQFFNVFNHPNFALPSLVYAGIPGKPATQTGFGALTSTTSPPTGLLGVGLGGDSSPRMIAFHARLEF